MSTPQPNPDMSLLLKQWQEQVNALCHNIFQVSEDGQKLLWLWEQRYFFGPTAPPNEPIAFARFREGRNDFIRSIRASIMEAQKPKQQTQLNKDIEHGNENE